MSDEELDDQQDNGGFSSRWGVSKTLQAARNRFELWKLFIGHEISEALVTAMIKACPVASHRAVKRFWHGSLMQYGGEKLTAPLLDIICLQVTARAAELKTQVINRESFVTTPQWICFEIRAATVAPHGKSHAPGVCLTFLALDGSIAGLAISQTFGEGWVAHLAYGIGFSRRYPYDYDPRVLIGLRFYAYVLPQNAVDDKLVLERWNVSTENKKTNQAQVRLRSRFLVAGTGVPECPEDFDHDCVDCPLTRHSCVGSVKWK